VKNRRAAAAFCGVGKSLSDYALSAVCTEDAGGVVVRGGALPLYRLFDITTGELDECASYQ